MPYSSWHVLHHRASDRRPEHRLKCPLCRRDSAEPTAHRRKLFLVAERLSWEDGLVPRAERELNEELTWEVNYCLGLHEPAIEDPDHVPGGRLSRLNQWHPFADEDDCVATLKLVASADCLTQKSWTVWSNLVGSLRESQTADPLSASSKQYTGAYKSRYLPTPPSSLRFVLNDSSPPPASPPRLRTLQEFYALLDSIERSSFVGAQFLEAYAEQLRDDLCNDCWFKHNILPGPPSP
ncbi:uncharacterized protein K452DRAFT_311771 [Aplosporella prunicola CBS 121167]|uniref:Uncharacterized protein n=1 Tax=Aplosporella prunicola CBS 121167 TaxID=1176127 RepID=A0A6A6B1A2_9PEZI|nr:uncharacterized protein K452DRAFT_311771 [Aplosporella prunicola CBS 121167]KAF2137982.1 hypothetical protein K452DRAFT_311771 [Aplosporella prunicola CBS 121167]